MRSAAARSFSMEPAGAVLALLITIASAILTARSVGNRSEDRARPAAVVVGLGDNGSVTYLGASHEQKGATANR